jgi:hypothetical protein
MYRIDTQMKIRPSRDARGWVFSNPLFASREPFSASDPGPGPVAGEILQLDFSSRRANALRPGRGDSPPESGQFFPI